MDVANLALALNPAAGKTGSAGETLAEKEEALHKTAQEFETVFIAEMLSHAGFDKAIAQDSGFGGEACSSRPMRKTLRKKAGSDLPIRFTVS
jgi:hypothetical protein